MLPIDKNVQNALYSFNREVKSLNQEPKVLSLAGQLSKGGSQFAARSSDSRPGIVARMTTEAQFWTKDGQRFGFDWFNFLSNLPTSYPFEKEIR